MNKTPKLEEQIKNLEEHNKYYERKIEEIKLEILERKLRLSKIKNKTL